MADLTYHCEDCKTRNELADKLDTAPGWLRQHPAKHAIGEQYEQLQLFHDRRSS